MRSRQQNIFTSIATHGIIEKNWSASWERELRKLLPFFYNYCFHYITLFYPVRHNKCECRGRVHSQKKRENWLALSDLRKRGIWRVFLSRLMGDRPDRYRSYPCLRRHRNRDRTLLEENKGEWLRPRTTVHVRTIKAIVFKRWFSLCADNGEGSHFFKVHSTETHARKKPLSWNNGFYRILNIFDILGNFWGCFFDIYRNTPVKLHFFPNFRLLNTMINWAFFGACGSSPASSSILALNRSFGAFLLQNSAIKSCPGYWFSFSSLL